jgi:hypothetical protein
LGDTASQQPPDGVKNRTSAFPESTRARRHAVAVGVGAGCGRLLSVDCARPVTAPTTVSTELKQSGEPFVAD